MIKSINDPTFASPSSVAQTEWNSFLFRIVENRINVVPNTLWRLGQRTNTIRSNRSWLNWSRRKSYRIWISRSGPCYEWICMLESPYLYFTFSRSLAQASPIALFGMPRAPKSFFIPFVKKTDHRQRCFRIENHSCQLFPSAPSKGGPSSTYLL